MGGRFGAHLLATSVNSYECIYSLLEERPTLLQSYFLPLSGPRAEWL
jgi:hypothetical protein